MFVFEADGQGREPDMRRLADLAFRLEGLMVRADECDAELDELARYGVGAVYVADPPRDILPPVNRDVRMPFDIIRVSYEPEGAFARPGAPYRAEYLFVYLRKEAWDFVDGTERVTFDGELQAGQLELADQGEWWKVSKLYKDEELLAGQRKWLSVECENIDPNGRCADRRGRWPCWTCTLTTNGPRTEAEVRAGRGLYEGEEVRRHVLASFDVLLSPDGRPTAVFVRVYMGRGTPMHDEHWVAPIHRDRWSPKEDRWGQWAARKPSEDHVFWTANLSTPVFVKSSADDPWTWRLAGALADFDTRGFVLRTDVDRGYGALGSMNTYPPGATGPAGPFGPSGPPGGGGGGGAAGCCNTADTVCRWCAHESVVITSASVNLNELQVGYKHVYFRESSPGGCTTVPPDAGVVFACDTAVDTGVTKLTVPRLRPVDNASNGSGFAYAYNNGALHHPELYLNQRYEQLSVWYQDMNIDEEAQRMGDGDVTWFSAGLPRLPVSLISGFEAAVLAAAEEVGFVKLGPSGPTGA